MEEDDFLPISALEHLAYCPRQCALIHVDGVWIENGHTAAGRVLHERADSAERTTRPDVRVARSVLLRTQRLRLRGVADVVEFHPRPGGDERPYPVEYKRGRRARWLHDEAQLCAQAIALEEMTGVPVPEGAIYHGASKRRRVVAIDEALRRATAELAARLHEMVARRLVPAPVHDERCEACSLRDACMPGRSDDARSLREAFERAMR